MSVSISEVRRPSSSGATAGVEDAYDTLGTASANEIFAHLTVKQVQALRQKYAQGVADAKREIHALVGSKYRDLIDIAEDIDDMYAQTGVIDSQLSELALGQSSFVKFGPIDVLGIGKAPGTAETPVTTTPGIGHIRFEADARRRAAAAARRAAAPTILRNLLSTLISYDTRISSDAALPPPECIELARYYHSVEVLFAAVLRADRDASSTFTALKQNFSSYLENQLCTENDLTVESVWRDARWSDDDDDASVLVAYAVLNAELDSVGKVAEGVLQLRSSYFAAVLAEARAQAAADDPPVAAGAAAGGGAARIDRANFAVVFRYAERTYREARVYFGIERAGAAGPTATFAGALAAHTHPWRASDLLGFHHWLEPDSVVFPPLRLDPDAALARAAAHLDRFPEAAYAFAAALVRQGSMAQILPAYAQFATHASDDSALARALTAGGFVARLAEDAAARATELFRELFDELEAATQPADVGAAPPLFSAPLLDLLDSNPDLYVARLAEASAAAASPPLAAWFSRFDAYNAALEARPPAAVAAVRAATASTFWRHVDRCVASLTAAAHSAPSQWHRHLSVATQLRHHLVHCNLAMPPATASALDALCTELVARTVAHMPQLVPLERALASCLEATQPQSRPSFELAATVYHLADTFGAQGAIFADAYLRPIFIERKNAWMRKLAAAVAAHLDRAACKTAVLADAAYLLRFAGGDAALTEDWAHQGGVDASAVAEVLRGVEEVYTSNLVLCQPLSLT
ncbi:Conserved oligomeric Golgi complex subunit 1 [[Candida] zeylanoides]